jgi:hypothetical protein
MMTALFLGGGMGPDLSDENVTSKIMTRWVMTGMIRIVRINPNIPNPLQTQIKSAFGVHSDKNKIG